VRARGDALELHGRLEIRLRRFSPVVHLVSQQLELRDALVEVSGTGRQVEAPVDQQVTDGRTDPSRRRLAGLLPGLFDHVAGLGGDVFQAFHRLPEVVSGAVAARGARRHRPGRRLPLPLMGHRLCSYGPPQAKACRDGRRDM
jgi:hypothetical protein